MNTDLEHNTIIVEQGNNVMLACGVQYAYPTPKIDWNITTPLSGIYVMQQNNDGRLNYKLHTNGSIEIYRQCLLEKGYITVACSATNIYGSNKNTFQLWEHETYIKSMCIATMYNAIYNFVHMHVVCICDCICQNQPSSYQN